MFGHRMENIHVSPTVSRRGHSKDRRRSRGTSSVKRPRKVRVAAVVGGPLAQLKKWYRMMNGDFSNGRRFRHSMTPARDDYFGAVTPRHSSWIDHVRSSQSLGKTPKRYQSKTRSKQRRLSTSKKRSTKKARQRASLERARQSLKTQEMTRNGGMSDFSQPYITPEPYHFFPQQQRYPAQTEQTALADSSHATAQLTPMNYSHVSAHMFSPLTMQ
jgi:hypothetical protein